MIPFSFLVAVTNVYFLRDIVVPEDQVIRTDQTNILIRSLMIEKQKADSASKAGKTTAANQGSRKRY